MLTPSTLKLYSTYTYNVDALSMPTSFRPSSLSTALFIAVMLIALIPQQGVSQTSDANTLSVSTIALKQVASYEVKRVYAGQLFPRRISQMGFETAGVISRVHVEEGDTVEQGQLLASLDRALLEAEKQTVQADLNAAEANLETAHTQLKLSLATLKRHQSLAAKTHVSKQLLDELEQQFRLSQAQFLIAKSQIVKAKAQLNQVIVRYEKATIKAPFAAIVQSRHADEGSVISPGATVMTIVEKGQMEAKIGIPVNMAHRLTTGQRFEFRINNKQVFGKLRALLPQVNTVTGTVTAVFTMESQDLYSGTLAEMNLSVPVAAEGFWVPLDALAESQRGLWSILVVITQGGKQLVEARLVEIIHQGQDRVFVRGTLSDGDLIINSGTGRVVPGQEVVTTNKTSLLSAGN